MLAMNNALKIINISHNNRVFFGKKAKIFLNDRQSTSILFDRAPAAVQNEQNKTSLG